MNTIFLDNKYTKWYFQIVDRAIFRDISSGFEKHHIIPECFYKIRKRKGPSGWLIGNSSDTANIVKLTPREHFICHWLLIKMIKGKPYHQMVNALRGLRRQNIYQARYNSKITSRIYENLRNTYKVSEDDKLKRSQNAKKTNENRVKNGTHPFLGGKIQNISNQKRLKDGTHNFLDGTLSGIVQRKLVENGTHHFLGGEIQRSAQNKRVEQGTHHLLSGEIQRKANQKRLKDGSHNLLGKNNPCHKQIEDGTHLFYEKATCPHCEKTGQKTNLLRWHFANCKTLKNDQ